MNAAWQRLKGLALQRQGKLFGAAEVQRFNRYRARAGCRAGARARKTREPPGAGPAAAPPALDSCRKWLPGCLRPVGTWTRLSAGLRKRSS